MLAPNGRITIHSTVFGRKKKDDIICSIGGLGVLTLLNFSVLIYKICYDKASFISLILHIKWDNI